MSEKITIVDCPRDAIQGLKHMIPMDHKIAYLQRLIDSELFDCIDFGSFVSPKAVPQMADTSDVVKSLKKNDKTTLLAIIANERGAEMASQFDAIDFLGFPFSISDIFQKRNTNSSVHQSFERVKKIQDIMSKTDQKLVIYISMAFGNPFGDEWNADIVNEWIGKLTQLGIVEFSLADTTSEATPELIFQVFEHTKTSFPKLDLSVHLHSSQDSSLPKIEAAYKAGCRKFEGAILGFGGCQFASDDLIGNIPSELLLSRFKNIPINLVEELQQEFLRLTSSGYEI